MNRVLKGHTHKRKLAFWEKKDKAKMGSYVPLIRIQDLIDEAKAKERQRIIKLIEEILGKTWSKHVLPVLKSRLNK